MRKLIKILLTATLLVSFVHSGHSQVISSPSDTVMAKTLSAQTPDKEQQQKQQGKRASQQGDNQNAVPTQVIKQVKSARPDWSKSKGARPNISRPSGSSVPKGIGKPAGAGRGGK